MITASASLPPPLLHWTKSFNERIEGLLPGDTEVPTELLFAMRYSLQAPGKRLRPYLVKRSYDLAGGGDRSIERVCFAVECVHVFTLIHDDLPAMDDARLRRGVPTNHTVYGEATAILAGDALLALAVEMLTCWDGDSQTTCRMVRELTRAIGCAGVIGGQSADITAHAKAHDEKLVRYIHQRKTARLFQSSCRLGAIAAGSDQQTFRNLSDFGLALGLAFQISDDLLDVLASSRDTGKDAGGDVDRRKQTYPGLVGIAESRKKGEQYVRNAVALLDSFGPSADDLRQVARYVMQRVQ